MTDSQHSILVSVLEHQSPDIPNNIVSQMRGTFRLVRISDVQLDKDFEDCEIGEPLLCSIKVKKNTYKFLCELIKKQTYDEEAREVLKDINLPISDEDTSLDKGDNESISVERHSRRLQKTLFRPTELRRSKSLDNFRVKDDVLWQFGKTSENLNQNFASFCKIYKENNDKMMKSLETIQKCLQVQVGNQEQFCLNLSQINHGIQVLVGLISKNIAAKDNSTISKNAPDIPRTSNSLGTDEHDETSNNVSYPGSNIKSSDSESSSDDENDKECSNDNNCNVQKTQDCEMELADQPNLSNTSQKSTPLLKSRPRQVSSYDFNAYLEKLVLRHIKDEKRRNDGFDILKKDFKLAYEEIRKSFFGKCENKGETEPKLIWERACNARKSKKSKKNLKIIREIEGKKD